jgi:hypothetical protein
MVANRGKRTDRQRVAMSARRRTDAERVKRPPLTPEENSLAHEVAAYVADLRASGSDWDCALIQIDKAWPRLSYRLAIAGLFLAQLQHEQKQQKRRLQ